MSHAGSISARQLWTPPTPTTQSWSRHCTPFVLPSNGVLSLKDSTITLTTNVVFRPECTGTGVQEVSSIADFRQPFYSSTIPQTYVIAAATVIAWILVIMLIITPRTNFFGHSGAAPAFSNGRGIIGGASGGSTNLIGVGSRPWLQKVAALTVAVSLTIATADTFQVARTQYISGYMDADSLRRAVLQSVEIRVTRVVSDIFLWLAQVQTLIRLFPRHKEKVLIKWIGFALILFDSLFSCLNSFLVKATEHQPGQFQDAIPALSYLFELALGLLYAAWVMYYSATKRRYAYYHSKMRSITLIACLSFIAILTPVVFFVTDVSNNDVAGWGDYFRWVGAAAASVVVWEWVERIEALERDEKKDGILGREIFDGDEMLDVIPSDDVVYTPSRRGRSYYKGDEKDDDGYGGGNVELSALEKGLGGMARKLRPRQRKTQQHFPLGRAHSTMTASTPDPGAATTRQNAIAFGHLPKPSEHIDDTILGGPTPPPAVASPVSRADTTSAASTVYVVQHNPAADVPLPVRRRADGNGNTEHVIAQARAQRNNMPPPAENQSHDLDVATTAEDATANRMRGHGTWYSVSNPFKRKRASPPAEVRQAQVSESAAARSTTPAHNFSPWDVKNRLGVLAAETGEKFRDKRAARKQHVEGPVTIIPAQPRGSGRTWTPPTGNEQESVEASTGVGSDGSSPSQGVSGSTTLTANSNAAPTSSHNNASAVREANESPLGAGGTATPPMAPSPGRTPSSQPPRASDLSPDRGSGTPVVVPAPRRSMRSSPLATYHTSASSPGPRDGSGVDGGNHDHG